MDTAPFHPTSLDPYLPSGISRFVVFPTPSTAQTVLAVDLDDSAIKYYTTYPGTVIALSPPSLDTLAGQIQSTGQTLDIAPGLDSAIKHAQAQRHEYQTGRFYQRTMRVSSLGPLPNATLAGIGAFAGIGLCSTNIFGWEFVAAIPAVVAGLGTAFGLHLDGMRRDHNDSTERGNYDAALASDTRLIALSQTPSDLVRIVWRIDMALAALRSYGLSTDDHHSEVTKELEACIRSTHAQLAHDAEVTDLGRRLAEMTAEDIRSDHDLYLASKRHNQHLAERNAAEGEAKRALHQLRLKEDAVTREARAAKAKLAAVEYLSKNPEAK